MGEGIVLMTKVAIKLGIVIQVIIEIIQVAMELGLMIDASGNETSTNDTSGNGTITNDTYKWQLEPPNWTQVTIDLVVMIQVAMKLLPMIQVTMDYHQQ